MDKAYYSDCCAVEIPDYPDSDVCPACGEHCVGMTEEELLQDNEGYYERI